MSSPNGCDVRFDYAYYPTIQIWLAAQSMGAVIENTLVSNGDGRGPISLEHLREGQYDLRERR
jgi:hypothetical protein